MVSDLEGKRVAKEQFQKLVAIGNIMRNGMESSWRGVAYYNVSSLSLSQMHREGNMMTRENNRTHDPYRIIQQ